MRLIGWIIAGLIASLAPASVAAEDVRPRSMR
jgi:hypothetical protein